MKKLVACALTLLVPALVLSVGAGAGEKKADADKELKAIAVLHPRSESKVHGVIHFVQKGDKVTITGQIKGLTPGEHAFHIHEFGDCSEAKGMSAGAHFNPEKEMHGGPEAEHRHVGDLGNIKADEDGKAVINITDTLVRLRGKHSIVGRSVIVHEKKDDFKTQPTGDAGGRVACGVVGRAK
jgi:Cu-Zn family superoxide dismutase